MSGQIIHEKKTLAVWHANGPTVSVGVPVYNGEDYLEECFAALLSQTYTNLEIIVSDNCSTDRTAEICGLAAQADSRITYVRQDRNIGPLANFQYLLDRARGKYFIWQAADDSAEPGLIAALVECLEANPDFALAGADVRVVDGRGATLRVERLASVRLEKVARDWPGIRTGFFRYNVDNRYLLIYGLFRTDLAQRCSVDCDGRLRALASVEIPFLAQVASSGPLCSIDRPLKIYRSHGGSAFRAEARKPPAPGKLFAHYFNIWRCLWWALGRSSLPRTAYVGLAAYLLVSFPLYFARVAKREMTALLGRRRRPPR